MNFGTDLTYSRDRYLEAEIANTEFAEVRRYSEELLNKLPSHRELLNKVIKYGMQACLN